MMADPLSVVGGLAAALQLVSMSAQALLATIKLVKDLRGLTGRLALLLTDVDDSITRLSRSCNVGSKIFQNLDPLQLENLSRLVTTLYPSLQEIRDALMPLTYRSKGRGASVRNLWQAIISSKAEKELSQKLERLNRLNIEMIRELGILELEVQVATKEVVKASAAASKEAFSNIQATMDSLHTDFHNVTLSISQPSFVTLEKSQHRCSASDDCSLPPEDTLSENSQSTTKAANIVSKTPLISAMGTEQMVGTSRLSQERAQQMHHYLSGGSANKVTPALNSSSSSQLPSATLEFILFSVRALYTPGRFDGSPIIIQTEFWNDTEHAVYFMKVSAGATRGSSESRTRGLQLLKKVTANDTTYEMNQSLAIILIELLSTLSPVNTRACSHVRDGLLQHLSELARKQLPRDHPITLVIDKLKNGGGDKYISLRALTFIVERLRTTLGPVHELTQLATERLCGLLRQSGDYNEALRVAHAGVEAIRAAMGPGSLQERWLLRRIEHVYMDQCDWVASLSTCLDIVGQQQFETPEPDPLYHDECAVYTMEDIAKICECAGNLEQAVAWLKQAKISGAMLWGRTEAVEHVQDKLDELLREMGREDELEVWSQTLDARDGEGDPIEKC